MSFQSVQWALEFSPVADTYERLILAAMATASDDLGCGTWLGWKKLSTAAMCDRTTLYKRLKAMEERGVIARGDQRLAEYINAATRPVVWDIMIPRSWYSDAQWAEFQRTRTGRGLAPVDPETRPDIAAPEQVGRRKRSDAGKSRENREDVATSNGVANSNGSPEAPEGVANSNGVASSDPETLLIATEDVASSNPNKSFKPIMFNQLEKEDSRLGASASTTPVVRDLNEGRDDVERLCEHLAKRIEEHGSKRPTITKAWRDAARLLLDADGRTEEQVHTAIDWCQDDEFWRANILSLPKLRTRYDQLRLQAQRSGLRVVNGGKPSTDDKVGGLLARAGMDLGALMSGDSTARVIPGGEPRQIAGGDMR
ncbi:hypothetical protein [Amycolatopsis sp. DSM 110486]|uniref:hypothetical protein n=1 Tax=Amycolatopsis sp. DSM 110486 TaxID=2865832 RepID=UPI001C69E008|nr:hypothetical protein [Amycolatopsis sp. DSM 110486]QYN17467.1 hypothetical protein K1T34_32285 [Amycolatopsis sp. DSM 110486]